MSSSSSGSPSSVPPRVELRRPARYVARMSPRLEDVFDDVPISRHLGMHFVSRTAEGAVVRLEPRPELLQGYGVIQGGVISALADAAGACCFLPDDVQVANVTSIEFKLNFLRPARPEHGQLEARARVVQRGKKVGLADVDVFQRDELVAKGLFTYLLY